jgi:hypothetical protein
MTLISRVKSWFSTPNKPRIFDAKPYVFRHSPLHIHLNGKDIGTAYGVVCGPIFRLGILTRTVPLADEPETLVSHYSAGPVKVEQLVFANEYLNLLFKAGKVGPSCDDAQIEDFELCSAKMKIGRCSIYKWDTNHLTPQWTFQTKPGVFTNDVALTTSIMGVEIDAGFVEVDDEMKG